MSINDKVGSYNCGIAREGFRRNYLKHALELNLVCVTIPDKPNSKNQRYIKK